MAENTTPTTTPEKYEVDAILESKKYRDYVDIIKALCKPKRKYTLKQIDTIISDFSAKEV